MKIKKIPIIDVNTGKVIKSFATSIKKRKKRKRLKRVLITRKTVFDLRIGESVWEGEGGCELIIQRGVSRRGDYPLFEVLDVETGGVFVVDGLTMVDAWKREEVVYD